MHFQFKAVEAKMSKIHQVIIALALIWIFSIRSAHAKPFNCTEEPAVCKKEFAAQYDDEFKKLHVESIKKIFILFIEQMNIIRRELPAHSQPCIKRMDDGVKLIQEGQGKLYRNVFNDSYTIRDALDKGMDGIQLILRASSSEYEALRDLLFKHYTKRRIDFVDNELGGDVANLWSEMYSGLREKDLEEFYEYELINEKVKAVRADGPTSTFGNFMPIIKELCARFDVPYLQIITYY